jgi:hypothetical protein
MSSGEYCAGILAHIKEHLPKDHDQVAEYLIDMEHHYSTHPCQRDVSSLLAMLAIHTFSTNEFTEIVSRAIHPDTLVTAVLETIKTLLDNRDLDGANATFSFILAYADRPDKREEKYVAFRDFIEYAYYMTYCAPKHLPPVHPYLNTDILLQYARLCALSGDIEKAETFFLALQNASPINDAILFERADIARQQGNLTNIVKLHSNALNMPGCLRTLHVPTGIWAIIVP